MKKSFGFAVLSFVGIVVMIAAFDLFYTNYSTGIGQMFSSPLRLGFMGLFALAGSMVTFLHINNRIRPA